MVGVHELGGANLLRVRLRDLTEVHNLQGANV
jgi:hypothetical protein